MPCGAEFRQSLLQTELLCRCWCTLAEVGGREVEEVDDDEEQRQPKVRSHPQVDEAEQQQVRRHKVRAHVGGRGDVDGVARVQVPVVADLEDEEDKPAGGRC